MNRPPARRVFLALWPDATTHKQIYRVQQQLAAHEALQFAVAVKQENLHMTLHFIGTVGEDVIQGLSALLGRVESPVFDMKINHAGCFPKAEILWLGLENTPGGLEQLVTQTGSCISQCVEAYQQTAFTPHITLFRKARNKKAKPAFETITWRAESFALVESQTRAEGVEYSVIRQWPLTR